MKKLLKFLKDEEGAAAVEYGVLVALIIAICIVLIKAVGGKVQTAFSTVNTNLVP
jgi:pilus assembly protein Flp/PilA